MTSLKLYARNGSTQAPGCAPDAGAAGGVAAGSATCASFSFDLHATGVLADAEDHELSGLDGCDADDRDDHPGVDHVGRVRLVVALDRLPELVFVRLEHDPARRFGDRLLDHVEEASHVQVAPLAGRLVERPGAPEHDAPAREVANAVHADGIEDALLLTGKAVRHVQRAAHDLVRRRLVHAPAGV